MTDAREALRERVARAMYERWQSTRASAPPFDSLFASSLESELANADVAIALVLEEAAKVAEKEAEKAIDDGEYRGASWAANAIRALKSGNDS